VPSTPKPDAGYVKEWYHTEERKIMKKLWNWKVNFIRKYPVWSKCIGWCEGIIIGLLIYHFFLKEIIN
jgi:hypothetical protein